MIVTIPMKTTNPNNGQTGNSKLAGIIRARARASQRRAATLHLAAAGKLPPLPVTVLVTRVAPSSGLDPHDGLRASLKGVVDGIADALGLKSDRDPRVSWAYDQRRGMRAEWAVTIRIEAAA